MFRNHLSIRNIEGGIPMKQNRWKKMLSLAKAGALDWSEAQVKEALKLLLK